MSCGPPYTYGVLPCCLDPLRNARLPMYTTGQYTDRQVPICYNYVLGPPQFITNPPVPYRYFYWYGDMSTPDPPPPMSSPPTTDR